MIQVPTTGRGCRICIKRKVRCDKTRPFCLNCKKGRRPCPGYGDAFKFQDERPRLEKKFADPQPSIAPGRAILRPDSPELEHEHDYEPEFSQSDYQQVLGRWSYGQVPGCEDCQLAASGTCMYHSQTYHGDLSHNPGGKDDDNDREPSCDSAYQSGAEDHEILSSQMQLTRRPRHPFASRAREVPLSIQSPVMNQLALLQYFSSALIINPSPGSRLMVMRAHGAWLNGLAEIAGWVPLLDSAMRAVTLSHVGMANDDVAMIHESRYHYSKTLHYLKLSLENGSTKCSHETLSATALLSLYERFVNGQATVSKQMTWVQHASGVEALFILRGPQTLRYGMGRNIYISYRYMLVVEAFVKVKPCVLEQPEWVQLGWDVVNDTISAYGTTLDGNKYLGKASMMSFLASAEGVFQAVVQVPGALAAFMRHEYDDHCNSSTTAVPVEVPHLVRRIESVQILLKQRFMQAKQVLEQLGVNPQDRATGNNTVPMAYEFANTYVGTLYTNYYATVMQLCGILVHVYSQSTDVEAKEKLVAQQQLVRDAVHNTFKCVHNMERGDILGRFALVFPLRQTLNTELSTEERTWALEKLKALRNVNKIPGKGRNSR